MKVVLLEDVRKVGKKGDVVNVSDGYGQNFLIKNKQGRPCFRNTWVLRKPSSICKE